MSALYDHEMASITGEAVAFDRFRGQVLLIVNVASACGLTPQYADLRALHHQFDGFVVLGFPCNQFGGQEPGTEAEIHEFVTSKYEVDFPMFAKIEVNGPDAAPLYQMLKAVQPGDADSADITWNFEKFLVDRDGAVVRRFPPMTTADEIAQVVTDYL